MAEEVELKLELTPEGADAVERAELFEGGATAARLRSVYFDTAEQTLFAAGFSLRIRRDGRTRTQTVKGGGGTGAGLFARPEWERRVGNDVPILDDSTPVAKLLGRNRDSFGPVFEIKVARRIWDVERAGEAIEVALDRGEAIAGDRRSMVCEIEFEGKGGGPDELFALARLVDAIAPVRLGVLSKSERGYRLLGDLPAAAKATPIVLTAEMSIASAFQAIVRACLKQFRLNEMILLERRDVEALHQSRVALRRLRSAMSIHKPMVDGKSARRLNGELRWISGLLGDARNLDVLIAREPVEPLLGKLKDVREDAYEAVEAALASRRVRALMLDLAEWIALGDWLVRADNVVREAPAKLFATQALNHLRRRMKKMGRDVAEIDDEDRHEVRKAAKKLRYGVEFFASLYDRKGERRHCRQFIDALEGLQDQLGALNDMAMASHVLEHFGLTEMSGAKLLLSENRKKGKLLDRATEAHRALVRAKRFWRQGA